MGKTLVPVRSRRPRPDFQTFKMGTATERGASGVVTEQGASLVCDHLGQGDDRGWRLAQGGLGGRRIGGEEKDIVFSSHVGPARYLVQV